jgi:LDH2 family malate/lactate/ureidoglycolate dehydrogenase
MKETITPASPTPAVRVDAEVVAGLLGKLFAATGLSDAAAAAIAEALVEADLEGLPSHGVMQAEVYLERLRRGSVSTRETIEIVHDADAVAVVDSHHMLGHLAGDQAMALAVDKAKRFGLGAVAVRHAFHFGTAGRYARQAARAGCIGIVMCNSRPVMPAPGGAQKLVGTNPLAISVPTPEEPDVVLDMATSAGTVARLRLAAKAGRPIPDGWAVTADGRPTNDPQEGLAGMLLPMGGPKGFGLSLVIDLLCGLLSSGAWGDEISGLHGDLAKPADSSHFYVAIDVEHFRPLAGFLDESGRAAARVRGSQPAPGVARVHTPGERRWETRAASDGTVGLEAAQVAGLTRLAGELGLDAADLAVLSGPL